MERFQTTPEEFIQNFDRDTVQSIFGEQIMPAFDAACSDHPDMSQDQIFRYVMSERPLRIENTPMSAGEEIYLEPGE